MRRVAWVLVVLAAVAGCKKSKKVTVRVPAASPTPDAAVVAAPPDASVDAGELSEEALRQGKRTGLGGPDDKPEVATEELLAALAEGKFDPARLVHPEAGVVEVVIMPGGDDKPDPEVHKHHCGKQAAKIVKGYAARMHGRGEDYSLGCTNGFLATPEDKFGAFESDDPKEARPGHSLRYAVCSSGAAGEYDANYEMILVPDPAGGLRVAAILEWEAGANPEGPWSSMADDLFADRKPCH